MYVDVYICIRFFCIGIYLSTNEQQKNNYHLVTRNQFILNILKLLFFYFQYIDIYFFSCRNKLFFCVILPFIKLPMNKWTN